MKKRTVLSLVCLLVISVLMVGCGNKETENSSEESMKTEVVTEENVKTEDTDETAGEEEKTEETEITVEGTSESESGNEGTSTGESKSESVSINKNGTSISTGTSVSKSTSTSKNKDTSTTKSSGTSYSKSTNVTKEPEKKVEAPKETTPAPTTKPEQLKEQPKEEPKKEEKPAPTPQPSEPEKKGLMALSNVELKGLLDEVYPGDNITQKWIDTHPGEKLYEYMWGKYEDTMVDFYRASEKAVDESTIECQVSRTLPDNSLIMHTIRLKVNGNGIWSVISDSVQ